jgi:hypothetical protein
MRLSLTANLILCACWTLLAGCAGYQIGSSSLYRADVRTVHVPMIQSDSFRRFLGERLTEAVVKEIENRTIYKVTSFENADTILQARIVTDEKRVLAETINDDPRNLEYDMTVEVAWTDRIGRPMTRRPGFRVNYGSNFIPEAGQSITTAQQETIDRVARQIVNQMEAAW